IAAAVALRLGQPVRFIEGRADNLAGMQGRGLHFDVALHARADGTIVGLEVDECCDAGAYPAAGSIEPGKTNLMACGPYRVPAVTASAGQQHERAFATLVADVLPVSIDDIEVIEGDTGIVEGSAGTSGSRSLQLAGSAVHGAALDVLEQARLRAADLLEAAV